MAWAKFYGNNWTEVSLIKIAQFEDGALYVRDGHHRVVAVYLGGRDFLHSDEYVIQQFTYKQFTEINLDVGWVTPLDPRTEARLPELSQWKQDVRRFQEVRILENVEDYIERNRWRYATPKVYHNVPDMAMHVACRLLEQQNEIRLAINKRDG